MNIEKIVTRWRRDADAYGKLKLETVGIGSVALPPEIELCIRDQHPALADEYRRCAQWLQECKTDGARSLITMLRGMAKMKSTDIGTARQLGLPWGHHLSAFTAYTLCAYELERELKLEEKKGNQ